MALIKARRPLPPLDQEKLQELALSYVSKYSTTRAKLCSYLKRKVQKRGWSGNCQPDFEKVANRFAKLGYINEEAYALGKSLSLSARGYGKRRLLEKLRQDGVDDADAAAAHVHADEQGLEAALRFAERRRIGPFSSFSADPRQRQKWVGAMVRAGHSFTLARTISTMTPGAAIDRAMLSDRADMLED